MQPTLGVLLEQEESKPYTANHQVAEKVHGLARMIEPFPMPLLTQSTCKEYQ